MLQLGLREEYLKSQATVGAHWVRWANIQITLSHLLTQRSV